MAPLAEVAVAFLRLGVTAFGGPAAHLAMMEAEFVRRRKWLTHEEFADLLGAANLIPGPSSTEVAMLIGRRRAGILGLILAGICFIVPSSLTVLAIAACYVRFGSLPTFQSAFMGIKPVVVAIVAMAIWQLFVKVVDTWPKRVVLAAAGVLSWLGVNNLLLLLAPGLVMGGDSLRKTKDWRSARPVLTLLLAVAAVAALPVAWHVLQTGVATRPSPASLFLYFLEVGSILYGGGYVLLAFLERDLVVRWSWLSHGQLIDATAVGQLTPGPVFTTATFIGYVTAGVPGAVTATLGIFLPAFVFVGVVGRLLPGMRAAPASAGFLDGVNSAAIGLMAAVEVRLGIDAVRDVWTALIGLAAIVLLARFRLNPALMILLGACAGMLGGARPH